ncbi:carboxymuconolactone decarboxylase family protein [Azospirillum sp.]|uniref:carboxymuconolactone decarboxylase family protein n=1 Tax=Azospirillum sp. TaxID=34012 RepID=UPI003D713F91
MDFRFDLSADAPDLYGALSNVTKALGASGLPTGLKHLIDLRVSQINGCAYCIGLHTEWAQRDGESRERIAAVADWPASPLFTPDEGAAFAWAEALTRREKDRLDDLHADLGRHFDRAQVAALTMAVAAINAWNRVGIAIHREAPAEQAAA